MDWLAQTNQGINEHPITEPREFFSGASESITLDKCNSTTGQNIFCKTISPKGIAIPAIAIKLRAPEKKIGLNESPNSEFQQRSWSELVTI